MFKERYFRLLKSTFPSKRDIATEIINLSAILNLPKGTEHFISDVHGEYEAFQHVLRNGSGIVRKKVNLLFSKKYSESQLRDLTTLVYYPEEKISQMKAYYVHPIDYRIWYKNTLSDLVELCLFASRKYTRSKVRKAMPKSSSYIIEELLFKLEDYPDKEEYYEKIVQTIFDLEDEQYLLSTLCYLIQQFVVDHLHLVGDIFDRGPYPDLIIERLMNHHSLDIQWGNHDVLWMGAACGSPVCIANVIRISARYNNLDILEDTYGINLHPLLNYAEKYYSVTDIFIPKEERRQTDREWQQVAKVHQAIAILQFKLEKYVIDRNPDFQLQHRKMLERIDFDKNTIQLESGEHPLLNSDFPTINSENPYELTQEELELVEHLTNSFLGSEKLQRHIQFLFDKGSMYTVYNGNLLYHGCIPMNEDGSFKEFYWQGKVYAGKDLFDLFDSYLRNLYQKRGGGYDVGDLAWYLWTGENSPLFGKKEMTTFERYYVKDKSTHKEQKNSYYTQRGDELICESILEEFGLNPKTGHIINGHTPIREKDGENPIKANGKMLVIDGGFSKPYQSKTGIAGYTLLYNSYGMELAAHLPFKGKEDAIHHCIDIQSTTRVVDRVLRRQRVSDTTTGAILKEQLEDLKYLYHHYCDEDFE